MIVGDTMRVRVAFLDQEGRAMAASGIEVRVKPPAGGAQIYPAESLSQPEPGVVVFDVVALTAGTYVARASCTGPVAAAVETSWEVAASAVL
jgi:hypothetical protein